jgi:hypothetical protein
LWEGKEMKQYLIDEDELEELENLVNGCGCEMDVECNKKIKFKFIQCDPVEKLSIGTYYGDI